MGNVLQAGLVQNLARQCVLIAGLADRTPAFIVNKVGVSGMKDTGSDIDKDFCLCSTELVNKSIARECGYEFSVKYDQQNGKCIQKFWRK